MTDKERFIKIYTENIKREGADKLLDFLENKSDFFMIMASIYCYWIFFRNSLAVL